jgi:hypothetical protein
MNLKPLALLLLTLSCLSAKANYIFNARCTEACKAILELRLNDAKELIRAEKQQNPQNGVTILLDNYMDYFSLLTSDNKTEYDALSSRKADRISALEKNKDNSPYYLYAQAQVYLQWGLLKGEFGDYFASARDMKKAQNLLRDNTEKYPDFLPDQVSLAMINVVYGNIPANLKKIASFFGIEGDAEEGIAQMEKLMPQVQKSKYDFLTDELIFFLCHSEINILHNKTYYNKLIVYLDGMSNKSLLKTYLQGYVSFKCSHNDEAIAYLENKPKTGGYAPIPGINYLLGNAKLCHMDSDANLFLTAYLNEYKGKNYIKDTYLKLAYYYLFKNEPAQYATYIKLVETKGYLDDEKDKQALKEAKDAPPNIDLLKARFYFDGGYFGKALAQIKDTQVTSLKLLRDKIELNYRLGRIYAALNDVNNAVINYQKAIASGQASNYYYASNAALNLGIIYEQKKDTAKATYYYKLALGMKSHEYQNSIDTQAKEGLKRLNK